MRKFLKILLFATLSAALAGCTAARENFRPSELSVKELEKKMTAALDPDGRYAGAAGFIQRFEVKVAKGWMEPPDEQMVEVKFAQPGNFKVSTSDEKGMQYAYIFNNTGGYMINYRTKSVKILEKDMLAQLRIMREIANPVVKLHNVFKEIKIQRCTENDEEFFLLSCHGERKGNVLHILVSADDYRMRKIEGRIVIGSARLNYKSEVEEFGLNEGLMVADLTSSETNGVKTESKLIYFRLNPVFSPDEFKVPVF